MSLKENYSGIGFGSNSRDGNQSLEDASKLLLLTEYSYLLRAIQPVRILDRGFLLAIVVLHLIHSQFSILQQVTLLVTAALVSGFWLLQELSTGRRLGYLGELIAATNAEVVTGETSKLTQPAVVPPPKKESPTSKMPTFLAQVVPSTEVIEASLRTTSEQAWTNAYINWRHQGWSDRKIQTLQRAEPILWFVLIFAAEIYQLVFALR